MSTRENIRLIARAPFTFILSLIDRNNAKKVPIIYLSPFIL